MGGTGVLAGEARWCRVWWRLAPARARKGLPMHQGGGLPSHGARAAPSRAHGSYTCERQNAARAARVRVRD